MIRFLNPKVVLLLAFFIVLGSCEGSMGCSGCGIPMEPIPGDFPLGRRVENAAQLHITQNAIEFLENNVKELVASYFPEGLSFDIPPSTQNIGGVGTVHICPNGGCTAHLEIVSLDITPSPPSTIRILLQVSVSISNLPVIIERGVLCLWPCDTCDCSVNFNSRSSGREFENFVTNIVMEIDTVTGYTYMSMQEADLPDGIENGDIRITNTNLCGLLICNLANLDFVKGFIIDELVENLGDSIEEPFNEAMCRTCETGCPPGSSCAGPDPDDFCVYPDSRCVPVLMGMMGRIDMGRMLRALSPGAHSVVDMLMAAGGYAEAVANPEAFNLGIFGGAEGAPVSECVNMAPVPCENDGDCAVGYTCREMANPPKWLLPCVRCVTGCPPGSSPRDGKPCQPDPEDPFADFDPTQPCIRDGEESCVPIRYCLDANGKPQRHRPPGAVVVPVADALKVSHYTHCVLCGPDRPNACAGPDYACSERTGRCELVGGGDNPPCQTVTEPVMMVMGISETFLRRALYGIVSSGALCMEIPPGSIPQLNTGTIAMALPLSDLVWDSQPVALVLRPSVASFAVERPQFDAMNSPDVQIGDSPRLAVTLRDVTIDFYAWVEETYSRFLTATFDLTLGLDFVVRDGQIAPVIRTPVVSDMRAYNNDLLPMDEDNLRNTLAALISLAMGFIPPPEPLEVPPMDRIAVTLPDEAIAHVEEGGESFLTLYANFAIAPAEEGSGGGGGRGTGGGGTGNAVNAAGKGGNGDGDTYFASAPVETSITILESYNPKVDLLRGTAAMFEECEGQPRFLIRMKALSPSEHRRPMEYRWRLNGGWWSNWSRNETALIESIQFVFQGRHTIEAQARVSGLPQTADPQPAVAELIVDGLAPLVEARPTADGRYVQVDARDIISPKDRIRIEVKKRYADGTESEWERIENGAKVTITGSDIESLVISATDEANNSSTVVLGIRGRLPPPPEEEGCANCAVIGAGGSSAASEGGFLAVLFVLMAAVGVISALKRRRHHQREAEGARQKGRGIFSLAILTMLLAAGCSCEKAEPANPCVGRQGPECCLSDEDCTMEEAPFCCIHTHECMGPPPPLSSPPAPASIEGKYNEGCDPGFFCDSKPDFVIGATKEEGCGFDWSCCTEAEPLEKGRTGTHLGMDVATGGAGPTIWVSGYSVGESAVLPYGDLVAGRWNAAVGKVDWEILDGVPVGGWVTNSVDGWRGGIGEAGDDVGLYTSLVLDPLGNPLISYHDKTNGDLKFIRYDGAAWRSPVVVDRGTAGLREARNGTAGTYSKILLLPTGTPAILYRSVTWEERDHPGALDYKVVHLATHLKFAVRGAGGDNDWSVTVVVSKAETPCWAGGCPEGYVCRLEDRLCWPPADARDYPEECATCTSVGTTACLSLLDATGAATSQFGCEDVASLSDVPEGIAIWTSADLNSRGEVEAVYYDRTDGELVWVRQEGGAWQEPVVLDGGYEDPDPALHGDRGWYPSLAIDANGNRHVVYVDGLAETLNYLMVNPRGNVVIREVIDDGVDLLTGEKELVGDNSDIRIDMEGRLRVVYQNTSDGVLMMAVKNRDGGDWRLSQITDPEAGFAGYYAVQKVVGATSFVGFYYFNFESPPVSEGVLVTSCVVDAAGIASCQ